MAGLILAAAAALVVLGTHVIAVCWSRALRTYSRNQLEELCIARGVPDRADDIARHDEATERSVSVVRVLTGLMLATLLGVSADRLTQTVAVEIVVAVVLVVAGVAYVVAGVIGQVYAETVVVELWPVAAPLRLLTMPVTALGRAAEEWAYHRFRPATGSPRPASVEVEVTDADVGDDESLEAELPDETRTILERAVVLSRRDVRDVMTPRASVLMLPEDISAPDAARAFIDSGFSRIPLYGEHSDHVVGILYAKDLFAGMFTAHDPHEVIARHLARPPLLVPETKSAIDLLNEFRAQRIQMAIVMDEYGTVSGLVTLEDLIEALVGSIDDEHDHPDLTEDIVRLDESHYEVDAAVPLEELNERLGLRLPTDEDFTTIGGLTFNTLGHVPEPGATFLFDGIGITVLEMEGHTIRRLRLDLHPERAPANHGQDVPFSA